VQALPEELRQKVLVRLCAQDWGWQQKRRWQEFFPFIRLDEGFRSMELLMAKSRLFISSYNATTYLESMSINMPTIIFWNPKQWELRDSAAPFFEKLKTVGIFHDTPESAAHQMAAVWSDVSGWWQSESVQAVRREFCERYTHIPDNPLEIMSDLFLDVQCKNDKASKSDLA
jgi:putative transferase (TIGR04331 family)